MDIKDLTMEDVNGKMTWIDVIRHYKSDVTPDEAEYILWNETCYPFSDESTLEQIKSFFKNQP